MEVAAPCDADAGGRNSDADAGLYWLARMLEAGEDPLYVARRLVRFASEDVGMADPQALVQAMAAQQAVHFVGMPEGALALAQLVTYLAAAPKSNALYVAYGEAADDAMKARNASESLLKSITDRLVKAKFVPDKADAGDLVKGLDTAIKAASTPWVRPICRPQSPMPRKMRGSEAPRASRKSAKINASKPSRRGARAPTLSWNRPAG